MEDLKLHLYPDGKSDYTIYEDDGNSLEYLKGAVAKTKIRCEAGRDKVTVVIEPRQGKYRDMPAKRDYDVWIHMAQPKSLSVKSRTEEKAAWHYDSEAKAVRITITEDPKRETPNVIHCEL